MTAPVILYGAHYSYEGRDRLDITRAGNDPAGVVLAPSWGLLMPFIERRKLTKGEVSLDEWMRYFWAYRAEMGKSFKAQPERWRAVLDRAEPDPNGPQSYLTFVCMCRDPMRCHRTAAGLFVAAAFPDLCEFHGECEPPPPEPTGYVHILYRGPRKRAKR